MLEEKILPTLPGSPKLVRLPAAREKANPKGHVWNGVLPKVALAHVLDEFQLVLTLNVDGSVSIWERNEGDLQDQRGLGEQVRAPQLASQFRDGKAPAGTGDQLTGQV